MDKLEGYLPVAPNKDVDEIDSSIVARMKCSVCGGKMRYEPYYNSKIDSYVALAICESCGRQCSTAPQFDSLFQQ